MKFARYHFRALVLLSGFSFLRMKVSGQCAGEVYVLMPCSVCSVFLLTRHHFVQGTGMEARIYVRILQLPPKGLCIDGRVTATTGA